MVEYHVEGGFPIKGTIKASGNKNAALPCIAACILGLFPKANFKQSSKFTSIYFATLPSIIKLSCLLGSTILAAGYSSFLIVFPNSSANTGEKNNVINKNMLTIFFIFLFTPVLFNNIVCKFLKSTVIMPFLHYIYHYKECWNENTTDK